MEYTVGLLSTGVFILIVTVYRMRKIREHHELEKRLHDSFNVGDLDISGNTRYASCFSHHWVINNITNRSHSRFGAMLQDHLANNTLIAGIWIGFIVGISSMILALLLVQSLRAIGTVIVVFIVGLMIAVGPSAPRYSEDLLDAVLENEFDGLNAQDYVYVKIANDTIKRSVLINTTLGIVLIVLAPWGAYLPSLFAQAVAMFTAYLIWGPAQFLIEFNIGLSIFYIAAFIGVSSYVCFRIGGRVFSQEEEEPVIQY